MLDRVLSSAWPRTCFPCQAAVLSGLQLFVQSTRVLHWLASAVDDSKTVRRGLWETGGRIASFREEGGRPLPPRRPPPGRGLAGRDQASRPLRITNHRDGDPIGTVVIALSGELDLTSADQLDGAIRDAEETANGWIVVDLSEVSYIDSTALSVLLHAKRRSDGRFSCIPSNHDAVTRLLEVTGTTKMLDSD